MPDKVAVPPLPGVKITPLGNTPDSLIVTFGVPVLVMLKLLTEPTLKVAVLALVIVGASFTCKVTMPSEVPWLLPMR